MWGLLGLGGDAIAHSLNKLLTQLRRPPSSNPSLSAIKLLPVRALSWLHMLASDKSSAKSRSGRRSLSRPRGERERDGPDTALGFPGAQVTRAATCVSVCGAEVIARSIAARSVSIAPSVHPAYTRSIVAMLCTCCLATQSALRPIIRFQLTDECLAQYGFR